MPSRQRLLLYQLLLSLIATVYALCNPPRRFEEHLRSLEALDNLVLLYSVLGGYAFFVFSLLYGVVFSLVTRFFIRLFHALIWTFGACRRGVPYLNVIETSLDWVLREERYKLNVAALQKNNDALNTTLATAVEARHRTGSALKKEKARARKRDADVEQRKRTTNRIIHRLQGHKRALAARVADREAVIRSRDSMVRLLETEVLGAQGQVVDLSEQLTDAKNLAQEQKTSAKALTTKTLEQETVIEGLIADLELEKQTREHWADRARESAEIVDGLRNGLQVSLAEQEEINSKLCGELETQQRRAHEAEAKIADLEVRKGELEASNETWKARTKEEEAQVHDLTAQNVTLQATIDNFNIEVEGLKTEVAESTAKAENWEDKAHNHEADAAEWKALAVEEQTKGKKLETSTRELEVKVGDLKTCVAEYELRAIALVAEIDEGKTVAREHERTTAEWKARTTTYEAKATDLESRNVKLEATVVSLRAEVVHLETRSNDFAAKAEHWESKARNYEADVAGWKTHATEQQIRIEGLETHKYELEGEIGDLKSRIAARELCAIALAAEIDEVTVAARNHQNAAAEWEAHATKQHGRADKLKASTLDLEVAVLELKAIVVDRDNTIDTLETRGRELAVKICDADDRVLVLEAEIQEWEDLAHEHEATADEWKASAARLETKVDGLTASRTELESRVVDLGDALTRAEVTAGELESRINEQEGAKVAADQYTAQLEISLAESQQVVAVFIDRFRQGRDAVMDLTHRNTLLSSEHEQLKARVTTLEQQVQKAQADFAEACVSLDSDSQSMLDADFIEDVDLDTSTVRWSALEEQLAAMEADTTTFLIADTMLDFEAEDKSVANEDLTKWLDSEIDCLKYRLNAAQGELRASEAKFEEVKTELLRTTEELETQKRINAELEKARDVLQAKQLATPARVQNLKAQNPAAKPLGARLHVTPNKRVLAPQSKLATPKTLTPSARSPSTRTSGRRENLSPATLELQMDRDALKAKLAASEKRIHDLKAQLANVSNKADTLQVKLDKAFSNHGNDDDKEGTSADVGGSPVVHIIGREVGTSLHASPAEAVMPEA
ncbi:hypothetical protein FOMPIDRAFT_1019141 [Fomitopsis schrenkii]|uniref:Uncharacterized protein n=1 Tax=Fomitopsis schrenkii TaxID=2126942 RepID=S8DRM4_FOMSC|nr:hypothetical protein FOMPIDRAFT_1019141 [Fomitopsis schrenkii]